MPNNRCVICDSTSVYKSRNTSLSVGEQRHICICSDCQHIWRSPLPTQDELLSRYCVMEEQNSIAYDQHNHRRLNRIRKIRAGEIISRASSILEIGPGKNGILPIAESAKQYEAVELSVFNTAELIKANTNATVKIYKNIMEVQGKYDLIVLISLLEHVSDPKSIINDLEKKLNKGGYIIIGVPRRDLEIFNSDKLFFNKNANLPSLWSDDAHLHSFSQESIEYILNCNNLKIEFVEKIGMDKFLDYMCNQNTQLNELLEISGFYSIKRIGKIFMYALILRLYKILCKDNKGDYLGIYTCSRQD